MRRERAYPAKRQATARIVAVLHGVVVVPLRLSPGGEGERVRFTFITCAVGIRNGPRHVLNTRSGPYPTEVRFTIRESRCRPSHVDLCCCRLSNCRRRPCCNQTQKRERQN